ncbi:MULTISPECIES: glycosyltransferase family 4 protein [Sphingobacterium]|uniref:glycosyltransferase family 4 protein n=1 Tax=Sphingobacterium TaxID=28453 RepID=UPI0013DCFACB|nr:MULTISPECIES: glycosyltransferase family 4 protein [unclassified Sphingobacterium]
MSLVFLSPYPNDLNSKDGMIQRVKHIDQKFENLERVYIDSSYKFSLFKRKFSPTENVIVYKLNTFFHFFIILNILIKARVVYSHSLMGIFNVWPAFIVCPGRKFVLDAHGIFPEELRFNGSRKFVIFSLLEKITFSKITKVICVTNAMKSHYLHKYPQMNIDYFVYYILPSIKTNVNLYIGEQDKLEVIYSGNLQKWQNIDLMLKTMEANDHELINYTVLTGDLKGFEHKLKFYSIKKSKVVLKSVAPSELGAYYEKAHYGFLLRDDIDVNRVSNPTKMVEYLNYGIVPIVKCEKIGDFNDLGYDYLKYVDFNKNLKPGKSIRNASLFRELESRMKLRNLQDWVLKSN